jgi:hypothetical protein
MANNSYAQLIDDFEAGLLVLEGESLTDYITRMGGVDYESKANGGIMGYAEGGLMSPEEYFLGKEKYMKEEQIENMRREYNEYLYKQNHGPRDEAANGGIMGYANGGKTKQAKNLLNKKAPKGEQLAYINSKEANLLKRMGGAGIDVNGTGIKSYMDDTGSDYHGGPTGNTGNTGGGGGGGGGGDSGNWDNPFGGGMMTKSPTPTIDTSDNGSTFNTIKQNIYNSPFKTKGVGKTLGFLLGNIFMPGIGGLLGGYLGGKKATSMANKFNLNKENLAEVPNIAPFYDYKNTTNPINKDIGIINKDISNQMATLTRAQKTRLETLKTQQESSDTFGPLTPGQQQEIKDLQNKEKESNLGLDTITAVAANGGLATMFRQKR